MEERGLIHRLSNTYQTVLIGLSVLFPSVMIGYLHFNGGETIFVHAVSVYDSLAIGITVVCGIIIVIAFACYKSSGEPAMRYILWGLLGQGLSFCLRPFLTSEIYYKIGLGSEPRAFFSLMLLFALFHWRNTHKSPQDISWKNSIFKPWLLLMMGQALVIYIVGLNPWYRPGVFFNAFTLLLTIPALIQLYRLMPANRPIYVCVGILLLNAQISMALAVTAQWSQVWWLGIILFMISILIIGHAIAVAYLTTRSFAATQSERQIFNLMREAEKAAETAHRANAAKSRFMAAASHDLRQPLVPIKLFAELLDAEIRGTPQGPLVRKLRSAVQSLDDLLNKMMEFSRLEAGVVHTRSERVRLGEVLKRFHQEFGPVAEAKGLELRWVDSSIVVRTDRVLFELILRNLVENAIRYTKNGRVLIGCRWMKGRVRLCVYDTGVGIPIDQHHDVFTEFFQGDAGNTDRRVGLGLGLATVERLSKLLEIPVEMTSIPGKGSCFSVTLPRTGERRAQLRPTNVKQLPDPGFLKILLVDDDPEVREGVVAALLRRGWEPLVATNVEEAIEAVESEGIPDAIVTDLRLNPNQCGLDAISAVHKITGTNIASVIITGDASHHRLPEAMSSPWPILVKPFSTDELYTAVTEMVLKARASSNDSKM